MSDELPEGTDFIDMEGLAFTPEEHERLKSLLHGEKFKQIAYSDQRYLVLGAGGTDEKSSRPLSIYDILGNRPNSISFRLEDFGLISDEIALWAAAYENLCETATHIVLVIEDYEGDYVWEMGYLYHSTIRKKVWALQRDYGSEKENRKRYNNGMAASHLRLLLNADRTFRWEDSNELKEKTENIP
ncbi:hypothetical protein [Haladaptatus sp. CMAA 1911]|uniref:hypothetical protein n=1 Tax=unclassified Haladaptatus TaxID=2622732 RepID=UPI0037550E4E